MDREPRDGERKFVFTKEKLELLGEWEVEVPATADDEDSEANGRNEEEKGSKKKRIVRKKPAEQDPGCRLVETYYDQLLEMETDAIQPVVRDDQLLEMSAG